MLFGYKALNMSKIIPLGIRAFCKIGLEIESSSNEISQPPEYNYGLSGMGKGSTRKPHRSLSVKPEGEVLFGVHPVLLALRANTRLIHRLFIKPFKNGLSSDIEQMLNMCEAKGVQHTQLSTKELNVLSGNRPHQGVCMDVSKLPVSEFEEEDFMQFKNSAAHSELSPIWLLQYKIKDPMNVGAILRSAYFLGISTVLMTRTDSASLTPVVSKASSGALEVININHVRDTADFLKMWKNEGYQIVGTTSDKSSHVVNVCDCLVDRPTLVVVGNESDGIDEEIQRLCNTLVNISIPHASSSLIDSLNVSVATGTFNGHLGHKS